MQALCLLQQGPGLLARPAPRLRQSLRSRCWPLTTVAASKGNAPPPGEAPAAAPAPPPVDIPAYFQPAPMPPQQGQVYQAVPQYSNMPPPQPEPSFWVSIPPIVYIGVGVVLAGLLNKVMGMIKGAPQKMQEVAMQQMMSQMMKQMGGAQGGGASPFGGANPFGGPGSGANPFGGPGSGANPFGGPGGSANPFGGAGGVNPFGGANPFGAPPAAGGAGAGNPFGGVPSSGFPSSFPNMQPAYDTTASPAASAAAAPSAPAAAEPSSSSGGSKEDSKPKKRSAFVDVNAKPSSSGNGATSDSGASSSSSEAGPAPGAGMPPPPFGNMPPPNFGNMPPFNMPPGMGGAAGAGAAGSSQGAAGVTNTMLDMLKSPEMQKMLYPYLPEPMRNPETFEWMLSNPEYRVQLEGMLQQQAAATGSPAVQEMMQGMDMSPEKMQAQFDQLGMSPDQFISKVMADPDLASMMTNPKVMAAIAECTKSPMAIFNYQNDPEVLRVFEKMSTLFPNAAGGMPGMPGGMPPGFGGPPPPPQQ